MANRWHPSEPYQPLEQSDNLQAHAESRGRGNGSGMPFTPLWTRRAVFITFTVCFAAMLAILEVLFRISNQNQGLATAAISQHYLWAYGPTAILTLHLALWSRVDYRVRQMTPWTSSQQGKITASDHSLFKDYLSPTVPEILYQSVTNHDFNVTASGLISNLITLLIVVSTSLFVLDSKPIDQGQQHYEVTSRFLTDIVAPAKSSLPMDIIDAVDTMHLSYPYGTTPDFAFEPFRPSANSSVGDFQQATVNVFTVDPRCEEANLRVNNWTYYWQPCYETFFGTVPSETAYVSVSVPNCTIGPWVQYDYFEDGHVGHFAFYDFDGCVETPDGSPWDRFTIGVGEAKQIGSAGPVPTSANCTYNRTSARVEVLRSKQWICQPSVSIQQGNVTYNATDLALGGLPNITLDRNATQVNLSRYLAQNLWQTPFNIDPSSSFHADVPPLLKPFTVKQPSMYDNLIRILRSAPSNSTVDDLLNSDLFSTLAQNHYKRLMVQAVHAGMMDADHRIVPGTTVANEDRLVLREFTVRFMQGCLAVIVVLTLYILFMLPGTIHVPYDTSRLAGLGLLMSSQPEIMAFFVKTGYMNVENMRKELLRRLAGNLSDLQNDVFHSDYRDRQTDSNGPSHRRLAVSWWRPIPITRSSRLSISVLVIAIVITLQVLLIYSKRQQGLADVVLEGNQHLAWSIIPAAVMAAIAIYFRALSSTHKMFAPYHQLRTQLRCHGRPLFTNYLTSTEPEVVYHSLRYRQWAVAFMSFAAILSTFLTIIIAGIWSPEPIPATRQVTILTKSSFNKTSLDDGTTGNSAFISGLILGANLSYPQWTYQNLALTSIDMDPSVRQLVTDDAQMSLELDLPALSSLLNCTIYTESQIPSLTFYPTFDGYGTHGDPKPRGMFLKMPGPVSCAGNSTVTFTPGTGYDIPGWATFFNNTLPGCPTWNYFWGRQDPPAEPKDTAYNATYVRALSCYEAIEEVQVSTNLNLPSLSIDTNQPPTVLLNTTKSSIYSTDVIKYPYPILPQLNNTNSSGSGFWAMINYKFGLVASDFGKPEKVDEIVDAIKSVHGIIRAQQYNAALRTPVEANSGSAPFNIPATLVSPQRHRLVQNATTTHVLCGILAAMLICAGLASWFMRTNYVLPKNPCSIAAMISLLADSNIFADDSLMQELEDRIQRRKDGTGRALDHTRFQMGWFDGKPGQDRVFTINALPHGSESQWYQHRRDSSANLEVLIPLADTDRSFSSTIALQDRGLTDRR
ncbi:hypothetical protein H2198_004126 [Neophaeococcomyces mojaviensis]|uniref:Uncharacterized protein n=1 Tax=Neophaeococcomyces mojaviensis TaxID=3383035 RepID=A0ACC3A9F7_9EURO|nr:hypothetical protein H2198_004126 [Knufia sp. JES_112]